MEVKICEIVVLGALVPHFFDSKSILSLIPVFSGIFYFLSQMGKKSGYLYMAIVGIFSALIAFVLDMGKNLKHEIAVSTDIATQHPQASAILPTLPNSGASIFDDFLHNLNQPVSILLLQIVTIVVVARVLGKLANKVGQPAVIGEIIAGILLGPSLLGMLMPSFSSFLFPAESLKSLQLFSQLGLVFFMFIIGMEIDVNVIKKTASNALIVSHTSIIFPYFLGVLLSYFIFSKYAPAQISFISFALFMGIAMSITAFPVLARILQEKGLTKTPLGILSITCAATGDITAWCILPIVIAIAKARSINSALLTIGLSVVYIVVMLYVVKPLIARICAKHSENDKQNKTTIALLFLLLLCSSYVADLIGIHVLFGAFLAGVIMPADHSLKNMLTEKVEDVAILLLLPIFFVITGLRTQIGLLSGGNLWALCGIITTMAIVGKLGGSAIAAKLVGYSNKESLSLGVLMNTRGLMELIVLNIGYDMGILTPEIFAIMVIMAIATTLMTGPGLELIKKIK